jgi:hypothetical protein
MLDESRHFAHQPVGRPHPFEEGHGSSDAPGLVPLGLNTILFDPGLLGFAHVMAKGTKHQGEVVFIASPQSRGFVHHHQGVDPDIAFGMPAWILGDAAQGVQLGKVAQQVRLFEEVEGCRWTRCVEQELAKLVKDALSRHAGEVLLAAQGGQFGIGVHVELRRQPSDAQGSQGIVAEASGICRAQHTRLKIPPTAVGVKDFAGQGIQGHAVEGEIASPSGGGEVEFRTLRHGEVDIEAGQAQGLKALSHPNRATELSEVLRQLIEVAAEDLDVLIPSRAPQQLIPDRAAHDQRPSPGLGNMARDGRDGDFRLLG